MTNNIQIAISGGLGKMGMLVSNHIHTKKGYEISGIYDPKAKVGSNDVFNNFQTINDIAADYIFEFSPANAINKNILLYQSMDVNLIIGSSGLSDESINILKKKSKSNLICVIPNFSIGTAYQKLFSQTINWFYDNVQIYETHHENKKDSPSGTSIDLAKSIEPSKNKEELSDDSKEYGFTTESIINNINIMSFRVPNAVAEQTVEFKNEYESFSIQHSVNDREAYLQGIDIVLKSLEKIKKPGYISGLEHFLIKEDRIQSFIDLFNEEK